MPSATLATRTVAIFSEIPVSPITPNKIMIAAMIGIEAYKPLIKDLSIKPTMMITNMMAMEILPN